MNVADSIVIDGASPIIPGYYSRIGVFNIDTRGFLISADSLVNASSEFGLDGNIEINTIESDRIIEIDSLPQNLTNAAEQITVGCSLKNGFTFAGKGGLPENPTQYLRNETIWQDWRLPKIDNFKTGERTQLLPASALVREAQSWKINPQGNVELVANSQRGQLLSNSFECSPSELSGKHRSQTYF